MSDAVWLKDHNLESASRLVRETLILEPLGLPFFVTLAHAARLSLGFWEATAAGFALASICNGVWIVLRRKVSCL